MINLDTSTDLSTEDAKQIIVSNEKQIGIKLPFYFGAKVDITEITETQGNTSSTTENRDTVYNTFTKTAEKTPALQTKTGCYEKTNKISETTSSGIRYDLYLSDSSVTYTDNNNKEHSLYQLMLDVRENSSSYAKESTITINNSLGIYDDKFKDGIDTSTVYSPLPLTFKITQLAGINEKYVVEVYGIDGVSDDVIVFDTDNNNTDEPLFTYTSNVQHQLWCKVKKTIDGGNTYTYITDDAFIAKIVDPQTTTNSEGVTSTTYKVITSSPCESDGYFKLDLPILEQTESKKGRYLIRVYNSSISSVSLSSFDYYFSVGANDTWELKLYEDLAFTRDLTEYTAHYKSKDYSIHNEAIYAVLWKNNVIYKAETHTFTGSGNIKITEDTNWSNAPFSKLYIYGSVNNDKSTIEIWVNNISIAGVDTKVSSKPFIYQYKQTTITLSYSINQGPLPYSAGDYWRTATKTATQLGKDIDTFTPSSSQNYEVKGGMSCTLKYGTLVLQFKSTELIKTETLIQINLNNTRSVLEIALQYYKEAKTTKELSDSDLHTLLQTLSNTSNYELQFKNYITMTNVNNAVYYHEYSGQVNKTDNTRPFTTISKGQNNELPKQVVLTPYSDDWNNLGFSSTITLQ